MNQRRHGIVVLCLLAAASTAGTEWPGRERELASELETAPAARRIELLSELAASGNAGGEAAVVRALGDSDVTVRLAAAHLAGRYRLGAARAVLTTWLDDGQADVRAAGARALGAIGDAAAMPALVRLLGDSDVGVRLATVEAVRAIGGPEATVPLLDRLADAESSVRVATARALGELGDGRAVLSLLGALQDAIPEVREATATALGRLSDARAARGLLGLLRDPTADVRLAAVRALGTLNSPEAVIDLAPLTLRDDARADPLARAQLARAAVQSIGRIGGREARDVLVRTFRRSDGDRELLSAARNALRAMGDDAQDAVPALVASPVPASVFPDLVELLGDIGGDRAAEALVAFYETPPAGTVRNAAALLSAIGRTGTGVGLRALLRAASAPEPNGSGASEARVRGVVLGLEAYAARRGRLDEEALDPLAELWRIAAGLGESARETRLGIATMMGRTHNPRAAALLGPLLASPDPGLRGAVASALREVGVAGVEGVCAGALADSDPSVRLAIADALGQHGGAAALDAILSVWSGARPIDREAAARALGEIAARTGDARALTLLLDARAGASNELHAALLDALAFPASRGDTRALAAIADGGARGVLAIAAAEALANALAIAPESARSAIAQALARAASWPEPAARATAVWGLGHAGGGDSAVLVDALRDLDAPVVANAAGALARRWSAGETPPPAVREALCRVLEQRHDPAVRANVLVAIARGGLVCDADRQRRMLLDGRAAAVRRAAAESLAVVARGDDDAGHAARGALAQCASSERESTIARRCGVLAAAPAAATPSEPDRIDALVVGPDETTASRTSPFWLVMNDGVARVGLTGPAGWIHERGAPRGSYEVFDPTALPLEP